MVKLCLSSEKHLKIVGDKVAKQNLVAPGYTNGKIATNQGIMHTANDIVYFPAYFIGNSRREENKGFKLHICTCFIFPNKNTANLKDDLRKLHRFDSVSLYKFSFIGGKQREQDLSFAHGYPRVCVLIILRWSLQPETCTCFISHIITTAKDGIINIFALI